MRFGPQSWVTIGATLALYVGFFFLFGVATYRAARYRLTRTRWRGIRFGLSGSSLSYAVTFFWTTLLIPFTLGWIAPYRATLLQRQITNETTFGDRTFRFAGTSGPLYGPFALLWFGTLLVVIGPIAAIGMRLGPQIQAAQAVGIKYVPSPTDLGFVVGAVLLAIVGWSIVSAWYNARMINHFANSTHIEGASLSGRVRASGLIWLIITNFLIAVLGMILIGAIILGLAIAFGLASMEAFDAAPEQVRQMIIVASTSAIVLSFVLGATLFYPVVFGRTTGFVVRHLALTGTLPLNEILQSSAPEGGSEGLAQAFDIDVV